jgi:hypothetical protein
MIIDDRTLLADRVTAVLGFAELLLDGAYGPLSPEQERVLMDVVDAAKDVRDIVRQSAHEFPLD